MWNSGGQGILVAVKEGVASGLGDLHQYFQRWEHSVRLKDPPGPETEGTFALISYVWPLWPMCGFSPELQEIIQSFGQQCLLCKIPGELGPRCSWAWRLTLPSHR